MDGFVAVVSSEEKQPHPEIQTVESPCATLPSSLQSPARGQITEETHVTSIKLNQGNIKHEMHTVTEVLPDPAEAGDIAAWEQVKDPEAVLYPSPPGPPGSSLLSRAGHSVMNKIDELAVTHQRHQKLNPVPSQHTAIVNDVANAQKRYHQQVKEGEQHAHTITHTKTETSEEFIDKDLDKVFGTPAI